MGNSGKWNSNLFIFFKVQKLLVNFSKLYFAILGVGVEEFVEPILLAFIYKAAMNRSLSMNICIHLSWENFSWIVRIVFN